MASRTPRFGFNFFGGATRGSILDDGEKFTSTDRLLLDQILSGLESNDLHQRPGGIGDELVQPEPPATEIATGGSLRSGDRAYYRIAFVDTHGLESLASREVVATMPPMIGTPSQPIADESTSPGVLSPGLYYYALTALSSTAADADQSVLGDPTSISVLVSGTGAVDVFMPQTMPAGAALYAIWRLGPNESGYTRIGTSAGETFLDDGSVAANPCACDPEYLPPTSVTGSARYAVKLTLTVNDQAKVTATDRPVDRWRLYRAAFSGGYTAASLVAEITADAGDPLPITFTDLGDALLTGSPANTDQRLNLRPYVFDHVPSGTEPPTPASYPEFYPMVIEGKLAVRIGTGWEPIGGSGGGSSILTSPNGSRFRLRVADDGTLSTVPTVEPGPPTPPQPASAAGDGTGGGSGGGSINDPGTGTDSGGGLGGDSGGGGTIS